MMLQGLEKITSLLRLYKLREDLYLGKDRRDTGVRYLDFERALINLYYQIMRFQTKILVHLWKSSFERAVRGTFAADDWKSWIGDIEKADRECLQFIDVLDKHTEQIKWHRYCALVENQTSVQMQMLDVLSGTREQDREEKYQVQLQAQEQREQERRERLLESLASDYREGKDMNPRRVKGTCEWFLHSSQFLEWRDSTTSKILWVSAGPGCGKSVLSRSLIDEGHLTAGSQNSTVCYFFFKEGYAAQETRANALAAITHQMLQLLPSPSFRWTLQRFALFGATLRDTFSELWANLMDILEDSETEEIILLLDGLDESQQLERKRFLDELVHAYSAGSIRKYSKIRLKILLTSRPYHDIESRLSRLTDVAEFVQLDGDDKHDEISREIDMVIDDQTPQIISHLNKEAMSRIKRHLKMIGNQTYLWFHLMLSHIEDTILGYGTEKELHAVIDQLPRSLNEAYESILRKSVEPEMARKVLLIVLAAKRALSLSEMNVAFALTSQESCRSYRMLDLAPNELFKLRLRQLCGLFVSVRDDRVYLLHQSARDFLLYQEGFGIEGWRHSLRLEWGNGILFRICAVLLCFEDIDEVWINLSNKQSYKFVIRRGRQVFAEYSSQHLMGHHNLMTEDFLQGLTRVGLRLCDPSTKSFRMWWPDCNTMDPQRMLQPLSSLEVASVLGWSSVVEALIQFEEGLMTEASLEPVPREHSAICHPTSVRHPNKQEIDMEKIKWTRATAWQKASRNGRKEVAQLLSKHVGQMTSTEENYRRKLVQMLSDNYIETLDSETEHPTMDETAAPEELENIHAVRNDGFEMKNSPWRSSNAFKHKEPCDSDPILPETADSLALDTRDFWSNSSSDAFSSLAFSGSSHDASYSPIFTAQKWRHGSILAILSYAKSYNIPILPISEAEFGSKLGEGAACVVNSAEMPTKHVTCKADFELTQGTVVAIKRPSNSMKAESHGNALVLEELRALSHQPLLEHQNIVNVLGLGFETRGSIGDLRAVPFLVLERSELGDLATFLDNRKKECRYFNFEEKWSLCLDVAYGLEIIHACGMFNSSGPLGTIMHIKVPFLTSAKLDLPADS